jgi:hypothetical protein
MCLTFCSPQHKGHLPIAAFLPVPFNFHTPANNHVIPPLHFNEQRSIYYLSLQLKFISLRSVNKLFSDMFANILSLLIPLYPSFTIFATSLELCSRCFLHTNANQVCTAPVSTPHFNISHVYNHS